MNTRWIALTCLLATACAEDDKNASTQPPPDPGAPVNVAPPEGIAQVHALVEQARAIDADGLLARYNPEFVADLAFDPADAAGLDLVQASPVSLNEAELARLGAKGFVIADRHQFPSFAYGYETIYMADLPLFVSADSVLEAVHRSYDDLLARIEVEALVPALDLMLVRMRSRLQAGAADAFGEATVRDVDEYLAVALSLLRGEAVATVAGGADGTVEAFVEKALAADGLQQVGLFGTSRQIDLSQFTPRGHYVNEEQPQLAHYFRAMMWLGRIDMRLVETMPDGARVFRRRQVEAALALRATMDDEATRAFRRVDDTVRAFVGESDNMTLPQLEAFVADLGGGDPAAALAARDDAALAALILEKGYGAQKILGEFMSNPNGGQTLPLHATFLLLGQRYVVDSHVFSNVVYDRVGAGTVMRMMPDPLDAAFAALANDQAAQLLEPELRKYPYAPDLNAMRVLVDAHGEQFWSANLYNLWLGALRALSPGEPLPSVFGTEAWGRRVLNAQLASWAELRHDTLLYAKPSYTSGAGCEFPDAYVDPYPAFWAALERFATHGQQVVDGLADVPAAQSARRWFTTLGEVSATLGDMSERQLRGEPFSEEQMAFINRAVFVEQGCGSPIGVDGWYGDLFFDGPSGAEYDPTIADVHTQPTDEGGAEVGRVLHVATGSPRVIVVTAETCNGPRAYVGLVSSYNEVVTEQFERLTDADWVRRLDADRPPEVRWMQDLVVR